MSLLVKIRNIFIILKIFYWLSFKATIKALFQGSVSKAHENWAAATSEYFKIKLLKCRNSQPLCQQGKCLILSNHRSQADFFIHNVITNYQCNILSRMAVGVIFFIFGLTSYDSVWFFNRSGNINPEKFNEWMDGKFKKSKRPMLLAYPEGHRMAGTTSVSQDHIKTGMIRYSYRRQMPCQLMMTFGNEQVFNEKKISMNWGESVYYSLSKVYNPQDFKDENAFVKKIKEQFTKYFDQIYEIYTAKGKAELTHDFEHLE